MRTISPSQPAYGIPRARQGAVPLVDAIERNEHLVDVVELGDHDRRDSRKIAPNSLADGFGYRREILLSGEGLADLVDEASSALRWVVSANSWALRRRRP